MASPVIALTPRSPSRAFTAVGVFFYFAMTMALYAAVTLLHPGTALDRLWSLNPGAHRDLLMFRKSAGVMFLVVAAFAATGGFGWFRRRIWAWRLAVVGISTQVLGDCVNLLRGDFLRGVTGLVIAGVLLIYLWTDQVRQNFSDGRARESSADRTVAR